MTDKAPSTGDNAIDKRLKSFIQRIERLTEEKRGIANDIKEVFAEAKATGFDTRIMRLVIKERLLSTDELVERDLLIETYKRALGMFITTPLGEAAMAKAASA